MLRKGIFALFVCGFVGVTALSGCGVDKKQSTADNSPTQLSKPSTQQSAPDAKPVIRKVTPISGDKLYKRCAACHLPSGDGVVGAFPSLKGDVALLLGSDQGREYLVLVVYYGVSGEITLNGETYNGMMAAQGGMSPERVALVLNHIMITFNGVSSDDPRLYSADFVAATKEKYGRLSASKVAALRAAAYESAKP